MAEIVPVKWSEAPGLAVESTKLRPVVEARVRVPWATSRLIFTAPAPASGSVTLIRLPLPELKGRTVSSLTVWAPGTVFTGGSFTAVMERVRVAVLEGRAPSVTVKLTVRVVVGLSEGFRYFTVRRAAW